MKNSSIITVMLVSALLVMCQTMEVSETPSQTPKTPPLEGSQVNVPQDAFYFHTSNKEKTWLITPTAPGPIEVTVNSPSSESLEVLLYGESIKSPLVRKEGREKIRLAYTLDQTTLDQEKKFFITVRWMPKERSISLEMDVKGSVSISYPELKIEN